MDAGDVPSGFGHDGIVLPVPDCLRENIGDAHDYSNVHCGAVPVCVFMGGHDPTGVVLTRTRF
jgi:hypothetical protein